MENKTYPPIVVIDGDDYVKLQKALDKDTNNLLGASIKLIEAENRVKELEAQLSQAKTFLKEYLDTIEGIHDSDEGFLSAEHMEEYIACALWMEKNDGRTNHSVRKFKDRLTDLPY